MRYSVFPPFTSTTALPTSNVTVPLLGFGILPEGPRMRPSLPTVPIMSGVAMATSKSVKPSWTRWARSAPPTKSAPAASASRALSPSANTATVTSRPVPWGRLMVPRSCWSACRTLTPRRKCTSMVGSKRVSSCARSSRTASSGWYSRSASISLLACW